MKTRQLQAFHATVLTGSFTRAGESLNISQPSISRLVKDLEEATGLQLFSKKKGRIFPTPEGLKFYREVTSIFNGINHLEKIANDLKKERKGLLKIATTPALATNLIPKIIKNFNILQPEVSIELTVRGVDVLIPAIRDQRYDLAITNTMLDTPDIIEEKFTEVYFVCAIPCDHPLTQKQIITPADLNDESLLIVEDEGGLSWTQHANMLKNNNVNVRSTYSTQRSLSAYGMVATGLCIAILEPFNAFLWKNQGVETRPFRPSIKYSYSIYYSANQIRTPLAREFAQTSHRYIQENKFSG